LLRNVLFTFFVSGAASQPLGSFIPFLRDTYGFSYDLSAYCCPASPLGTCWLCWPQAFSRLPGPQAEHSDHCGMDGGRLSDFCQRHGDPVLLVLACLMTGIARGGNSNFANTMISTLPGDKATRGYNLLHGCFAVGALLFPLLLIFCAGRWPGLGWRIMAGLLCLLCISQLVVYAKMPLPPEYAKKSITSVDLRFFKVKQFWLGAAMLFFYISTEYAIVGWLVTYFQDIGVLDPNQSQMMNSLLWLVIFLGRMVGAVITGKLSRSKLLLLDGWAFFPSFCYVLQPDPSPDHPGTGGRRLLHGHHLPHCVRLWQRLHPGQRPGLQCHDLYRQRRRHPHPGHGGFCSRAGGHPGGDGPDCGVCGPAAVFHPPQRVHRTHSPGSTRKRRMMRMETLSYKALEAQGYSGYLLRDAPEKVLQFGEGNFLRAFVDYWFDVSNEKAGWNGKCVLVQPIPRAWPAHQPPGRALHALSQGPPKWKKGGSEAGHLLRQPLP
jgi:MFS family permease